MKTNIIKGAIFTAIGVVSICLAIKGYHWYSDSFRSTMQMEEYHCGSVLLITGMALIGYGVTCFIENKDKTEKTNT
jgi:hypothetical protein